MLTLAAVAAHKGIALTKLEVQVRRATEETDAGWETTFQIALELGDGLTQRERTILLNSARHCEVHKLLSGAMRFDYGLTAADTPCPDPLVS